MFFQVKIEPSEKEYVPKLYFGQNYSEVEGQQKDKGFLDDFRAIAIWPQLRIRMSPLKESCLGVDSEMEYTLEGKMRGTAISSKRIKMNDTPTV